MEKMIDESIIRSMPMTQSHSEPPSKLSSPGGKGKPVVKLVHEKEDLPHSRALPLRFPHHVWNLDLRSRFSRVNGGIQPIGPLLLAPISEIYGRHWVYIGASFSLLAFGAGAAAAQNFAIHLIYRFRLRWELYRESTPPRLALGPVAVGRARSAHLVHDPFDAGNRRSLRGLPCSRVSLQSILLPIRMLCPDMIMLLLAEVHTTFGYGVIFSFSLSFRYILGSNYGFDDRVSSLSCLSLVIGYALAILIYLLIEQRIVSAAQRPENKPDAPEGRLYSSGVGGVLVLVGEAW
ncbi:hypothetical protein BDW59DRAFT_167922 [Aspergillus cavernicola]|uniref:Major facilitator superfamily domain-containing protein n=1 Tax=Aspergillus cavernicola TaxID=176166 RepID=A0ABR4H8Y8_9EURO